ncbi:CinA family protein, partial [Agromyces binzhouensis]
CAVGGRPADLGLATTGVAGPDPQGGHPPGLVYIGVASSRGTRAVELRVKGDRAAVRRSAVARAVGEALAELDALDSASVAH